MLKKIGMQGLMIKKLTMGIEIVIQDHMGEVLACLSVPKSFRSKPLLAECWFLRQTIDLCDELGLQNVPLE